MLDQEELEYAEDIATVYQSIGYDSLFVSSVSELNMESLREILKDKTSVFFGHSGSGKSTLVNALNPEVNLKTGDISDIHLKGKHTTTFAQMHFWPFGGQVIDTPGVREFAMIDVEKEEIQHYFPEIFSISENCKFNNCLHINEPKCAVLDALEHEEILESRYATYIKLMEEAEEQNQ